MEEETTQQNQNSQINNQQQQNNANPDDLIQEFQNITIKDKKQIKKDNITFQDFDTQQNQEFKEIYQQILQQKVSDFNLEESIKNLMIGFQQNNVIQIAQHILIIRRILSVEDEPPIQYVIDSGILQYITEFIKSNNLSQYIIFEIAWIFTNISSGTQEQTQYIFDLQVLPYFVQILTKSQAQVVEQILWLFGNISGEGGEFRDFLIKEYKMLDNVLLLFNNFQYKKQQDIKSLIPQAAFLLSNLLRGSPKILTPDQIYNSSLVIFYYTSELLKQNLNEGAENGLVDFTWSYYYLSVNDYTRQTFALVLKDNKQMDFLVDNMTNFDNLSICVPIIRTIGNLLQDESEHTDELLKNPKLYDNCKLILARPDAPLQIIKKEILWTLSNIASENDPKVWHRILDCDQMLSTILQIAHLDNQNNQILQEACFVFLNLIDQLGNIQNLYNYFSQIPEVILLFVKIFKNLNWQKPQNIILFNDILKQLIQEYEINKWILTKNTENLSQDPIQAAAGVLHQKQQQLDIKEILKSYDYWEIFNNEKTIQYLLTQNDKRFKTCFLTLYQLSLIDPLFVMKIPQINLLNN